MPNDTKSPKEIILKFLEAAQYGLYPNTIINILLDHGIEKHKTQMVILDMLANDTIKTSSLAEKLFLNKTKSDKPDKPDKSKQILDVSRAIYFANSVEEILRELDESFLRFDANVFTAIMIAYKEAKCAD